VTDRLWGCGEGESEKRGKVSGRKERERERERKNEREKKTISIPACLVRLEPVLWLEEHALVCKTELPKGAREPSLTRHQLQFARSQICSHGGAGRPY
jgi:hypothetical protein